MNGMTAVKCLMCGCIQQIADEHKSHHCCLSEQNRISFALAIHQAWPPGWWKRSVNAKSGAPFGADQGRSLCPGDMHKDSRGECVDCVTWEVWRSLQYASPTPLLPVLQVNEEGTTASAATSAAIRPLNFLRETFTADRPFTFFIRDNENQLFLFMGAYSNVPT
eukprot:evm.model.scf_2726.2 EVM.evm.TU.scf_2726.2   scf_2726:1772-2263(+)